MRILIASQYYRPEQVGIAVYASDLSAYLAGQGHRVSVVTAFPFYPRWKKDPGDIGRLLRRESIGGVTCYRGYLYVPAVASAIGRIVSELSFDLFAAVNLVRVGRQDVIVVEQPPATLGLIACLFARLWRARLIIHVQDIPSDAAGSLGIVARDSILTRMLRWCERFVYHRCHLVIAISAGMRRQIIENDCPDDKVEVLYNWVAHEAAPCPGPRSRACLDRYGAGDRFVVSYAGNQGIKQGLDVLIELAERLSHDRRFFFLIVGDGMDNRRLRRIVDGKRLENVRFIPFLEEKRDYIDLIRASDVAFISQRNGTANSFFPSKLLSILLCRTPLLAAVDPASETYATIEEQGLGLAVPHDDGEGLLTALHRLHDDPALRDRCAENGHRWASRHDRETSLSRFQAWIEAAV